MHGRIFNSMITMGNILYPKSDTDESSPEKESEQGEKKYSIKEVKKALKDAMKVGPRSYQFTNYRSSDNFCMMAIGCIGVTGEDPEKVAELMDNIIKEGLITSHQGEALTPDVVYVAGDNFYPNGVTTAIDPRFETHFHDRYHSEKLKSLKPINTFLALGNHDEGRQSWGKAEQMFRQKDVGKTLGVNQVGRSYLENGRAFYEKDEFDLQSDAPYNMPFFFYGNQTEHVDIIVLNSNTYVKHFLKFLLKEVNDEEIDPLNQAVWATSRYHAAKEAGKKVIFVHHHPFFCSGKRAYSYGWDGNLYLNNRQMKKADLVVQLLPSYKEMKKKLFHARENKKLIAELLPDYLKLKSLIAAILNAESDGEIMSIEGIPTFSEHYRPFSLLPIPSSENIDYNYLFREIVLNYQENIPDIAIVAHEHYLDLSYHDLSISGENHTLCQIKSGGGGSMDELQEKLFFAHPENEACYFQKTGVFALHWNKENPDIIYIHIFTVQGDHLIFTQKNNEPVTYKPVTTDVGSLKQIAALPCQTMLRECVMAACNEYERFLDDQQRFPVGTGPYHGKFFSKFSPKRNFTHGPKELLCMHAIKNEFNSPEPFDFTTGLIFLREKLSDITFPNSTHSLLAYIDIELKRCFDNKTLEELYNASIVDHRPYIEGSYL